MTVELLLLIVFCFLLVVMCLQCVAVTKQVKENKQTYEKAEGVIRKKTISAQAIGAGDTILETCKLQIGYTFADKEYTCDLAVSLDVAADMYEGEDCIVSVRKDAPDIVSVGYDGGKLKRKLMFTVLGTLLTVCFIGVLLLIVFGKVAPTNPINF